MAKNIIVIIGESGCGKSTLQNEIIKKDSRFKKVVTYTTRPKRANELDGVDYHFLNDCDFEEMKENDCFLETAIYNDWNYGTPKNFIDNNCVVILTPSGFRKLKMKAEDMRNKPNICSLYLFVPRRDRLIKLIETRKNIDEAYRRNLSDVGMFDGVESEVDVPIINKGYKLSPRKLYELYVKPQIQIMLGC